MEPTAPAAESIGLPGRMARVFYAPRSTFEALRQRASWHDWIVPILLVSVVTVVSVQMAMPDLVDFQAQVSQQALGDANLTDEQRAQQAEAMAMMAPVFSVAALVTTPISMIVAALIFAAVYLLIGRVWMGGDVTYLQMLGLHAYASLITILQQLALIPLRAAAPSPVAATVGPGLLLDPEALSSVAGRALNLVDAFHVWQIAVVAVGLAVLAESSPRKPLAALLVLWALYVAGGAFIGGLVPMGMGVGVKG